MKGQQESEGACVGERELGEGAVALGRKAENLVSLPDLRDLRAQLRTISGE